MKRFMIVSHYCVEVIEAEDWVDVVYHAQERWDNSLVSITLLPEDDD